MVKAGTFLIFRIGDELFALQVENVIEILKNQKIKQTPRSADYIVGIVQFRSEVLSVVSAIKKFNVSGNDRVQNPYIIVIEFEIHGKKSKLGLLVDKVIDVKYITESEIRPVHEFGNYYNPEFLKGAYKQEDKIITILDVERIFTEEEITIINKYKNAKKERSVKEKNNGIFINK